MFHNSQLSLISFLISCLTFCIQSEHTHPAGTKWIMKEFCRFLVISCQKLAKILQLSGSVKSFWEACSFETLLYLQPFLSQHCTGSRYCDSRLKESCLGEEAWLDKSPGKFTELLTFPHSNSSGSNWLPLIRFPCCNWQLLIRCCQLLQ